MHGKGGGMARMMEQGMMGEKELARKKLVCSRGCLLGGEACCSLFSYVVSTYSTYSISEPTHFLQFAFSLAIWGGWGCQLGNILLPHPFLMDKLGDALQLCVHMCLTSWVHWQDSLLILPQQMQHMFGKQESQKIKYPQTALTERKLASIVSKTG